MSADATIRSTMAEVEREGVVYVAVYTADNVSTQLSREGGYEE